MSESHPPTQKLLIWLISTAIPPGRKLMVMLAIVFAGAAEGLGIATVLPLVAVLGDEASKENALSRTILTVLDALHMPHDPLLLLGIIAGGLLTKAALTLLALRLIGRAVADVVGKMRPEQIGRGTVGTTVNNEHHER